MDVTATWRVKWMSKKRTGIHWNHGVNRYPTAAQAQRAATFLNEVDPDTHHTIEKVPEFEPVNK